MTTVMMHSSAHSSINNIRTSKSLVLPNLAENPLRYSRIWQGEGRGERGEGINWNKTAHEIVGEKEIEMLIRRYERVWNQPERPIYTQSHSAHRTKALCTRNLSWMSLYLLE